MARALRQAALGLALATVICLPGSVWAQQVLQVPATEANGALLRVLDKSSGDTADLEIQRGQTLVYDRMAISLGDCRFPTNNPNSDAFAWVEVHDNRVSGAVFSGWMVASSPALSALDHPRYDIWLLRCSN